MPLLHEAGEASQVAETPWMDMDRPHACERICSLFTIDLRIPKRDVAGSTPYPVLLSISYGGPEPSDRSVTE